MHYTANNGYTVSYNADTNLPVKQLRMVQAWLAIHEDELYRAWNNAVRGMPFNKIEPLR